MGITERKEREKLKKRELLIDAAEKVFFKKGYENATMDEIAEKAEYSKGTLYLYFKNKEELYIAISTRSMFLFEKILDQEMGKSKTGKDKLDGIKRAYLKFFKTKPEYLKVMLHAFRSQDIIRSLHEDQNALNQVMEKDREMQEHIAAAIVQSAQEGTLPDGYEKLDERKVMNLVMAGGLLINGIFQGAFDMEEYWGEHFPFKAEEIINTAFDLLKF